MSFIDPMSSLLVSDAPIEDQTGADSCTGDMRIAADDDRLGEGDRDEPDQYTWLRPRYFANSFLTRVLVIRNELEDMRMFMKALQRISAFDDAFSMEMEREEHSIHCSVQAPKESTRFSTSDALNNEMPWSIRYQIIKGICSGLKYLHGSWSPYSIDMNLKPSNILLDDNSVVKISDFGLSKLLCAGGDTHIPFSKKMVKVVVTHNRPSYVKFSGTPSEKLRIVIKIGSHVTSQPKYLSLHHRLIPMLQFARKKSDDISIACVRLITSKRIFGIAETGWISAKPKYETPNAGPVSQYSIRKIFGIWNWLTVNESQQHSDTNSCGAEHRKMAVNTKTSASWIVATAAPHHATGNRNLLSGFVVEHDDLFVHAVDRVPMKVLARGAVVTDTVVLPDVWFVPGLTTNLVSVRQLAELDYSVGFGCGQCFVRRAPDGHIAGKARRHKGGPHVLDFLKVPLAM